MAHHQLIVNLAQEDLVVGLGVLMQFQFPGHFVGQFTEAADPLAFAQDIGGDPRMQVRHILSPFHLKGQTQRFRKRFHGALHREEILLITESGKAQMRTLVRHFPFFAGDVDVTKFENPAFVVAFFEVFHHDVHQARNQQRPHNGEIDGNRVFDPQHIALRCVRGNPQKVQVAVRVE